MKVYAITKGSYSDYHIETIVTDPELARKLAIEFSDKYYTANVEEYDTDKIKLESSKPPIICFTAEISSVTGDIKKYDNKYNIFYYKYKPDDSNYDIGEKDLDKIIFNNKNCYRYPCNSAYYYTRTYDIVGTKKKFIEAFHKSEYRPKNYYRVMYNSLAKKFIIDSIDPKNLNIYGFNDEEINERKKEILDKIKYDECCGFSYIITYAINEEDAKKAYKKAFKETTGTSFVVYYKLDS